MLILTGQFESAIEFLFRVDRFRSHSAHVAIALNENDLLAVATNSQAGQSDILILASFIQSRKVLVGWYMYFELIHSTFILLCAP